MDPVIRAQAIVVGSKDPLAVGVPWVIVLFLAMCCAMRLARFNTMLEEEPQPEYWKHFFVGLPAPGGAYVALMPLVFFLWTNDSIFRNSDLVSIFMLVSAILMASRIPTPSFKKLHLPQLNPFYRQLAVVCMLAVIALFVTMMLKNFWIFASVVGLIYLMMLPLGFIYFLYLKKKAK